MFWNRFYIYLYAPTAFDFIFMSGVNFCEFIEACGPWDLALLEHGCESGTYHPPTGFTHIGAGDLKNLCRHYRPQHGDLHCLNIDSANRLDGITAQDLIQIRTLCQAWSGASPFYGSLQNSFFYLSHDDGWLTKVYIRDTPMVDKWINNLMMTKLNNATKCIPTPWPESVGKQLRDWAASGIFIDLSDVSKSDTGVHLTVYVLNGGGISPIGDEVPDMDGILNNLDLLGSLIRPSVLKYEGCRWSVSGV